MKDDAKIRIEAATLRYELVAPVALHQHWPFIKMGLERTLEVCRERWLPEDIYTHLRIARAQCYLGHDGEHCRGFFITENKAEPHSNAPYMNVWIIYAVPTRGEHFADVAAFIEQTIGFLDVLARQAGARWIAMEGRQGWSRYLRDHFKATRVMYEREVSP